MDHDISESYYKVTILQLKELLENEYGSLLTFLL